MRKNLTLGFCLVGLLAAAALTFTLTQTIAAGQIVGTPVYLPLVLQMLTPSKTPTRTQTPIATATVTQTPTTTSTPTQSPTVTQTPTTTQTPTVTQTPTITRTPTQTHTATMTATRTQTQPPLPASLSITALSGSSMPEYVTITNSGGTAQAMIFWSIVSVEGNQIFDFPDDFVLGIGASVRVESYNGASYNPPAVLVWSPAAIWNNAGDKAELRSDTNAVIDSECYGDGCP